MQKPPAVPEDSLDAYKASIEKMASLKSETVFSNEGPVHASIVLGNIFMHSNEEVYMFAGNFNGEVSNQDYYLKSLKNFLSKKNVKINLVLESEPDFLNSKAIGTLLEKKKEDEGKVQVKVLNNNIINKIDFHFALGDSRMFRIETDVKTYKAICSFNDTQTVEKLKNYFDHVLIPNSKEYIPN